MLHSVTVYIAVSHWSVLSRERERGRGAVISGSFLLCLSSWRSIICCYLTWRVWPSKTLGPLNDLNWVERQVTAAETHLAKQLVWHLWHGGEVESKRGRLPLLFPLFGERKREYVCVCKREVRIEVRECRCSIIAQAAFFRCTQSVPARRSERTVVGSSGGRMYS